MDIDSETFDRELAVYYDRMIRWDRRMAVEGPLLEALLQRRGARRVLDAACGSGVHLEWLAERGLEAQGSDASPGMLELARRRLDRLPPERRPRLTLSTWAEVAERVGDGFDLVLCLGNSLAYVTDPAALERSLAGLWSRVGPGGGLVAQYKNFAMLHARGERFLPLSSRREEDGSEMIALRQYDWLDGGRQVDFLAVILERDHPEAPWRMRHWTTRLAAWPPGRVAGALESLGASVELCGSIGLEPFDPAASEDVVVWATRT